MEVRAQLYAPAALSPVKEPPRVGTRAGLDAVAKRKILAPAGNRIPVVQLVVYSRY